MNTKELYIAVRNANLKDERDDDFKKNLAKLLEKIEGQIFKPEGKPGKFSAEKWLRNGVAGDYDTREVVRYVFIDDENSIATNGKVLCIFSGRINNLPNGYYSAKTMEPITKELRPMNYRDLIPIKTFCKFEAEIYGYKGAYNCKKSAPIEFCDNGEIINKQLGNVIGKHNKPHTKNPLLFDIDFFKIATGGMIGKIDIEIQHDLNDGKQSPCLIKGFEKSNPAVIKEFEEQNVCTSLIMSLFIPEVKAEIKND